MAEVGELQLVTPRLVLRDFRAGDLAAIHEVRRDPEVARFVLNGQRVTLEDSREWLGEVIFHNQKRPRAAYNLAITLRQAERAIGWIGIGNSERYAGAGELGFGYMLARDERGRGYTTEAVGAILGFGFATLVGTRCSAYCHADNLASARVLEKAGLGFVRDFAQTHPTTGAAIACREFAITAAQWAELAACERQACER